MTDHSPASAPVAVATELAGYPQHWEADVVLVDGGVVHLRPAGAGDGAAIRAMHGRMSARTLFLRYFTPLTEVTDEQVASFTDTDYVSRVGLVAELGGEVIAAGTYHRNSTGDTAAAEVAFVVEDSQQRRGLGSILLEHLAAAAQERGIRRFTAEVLSENKQMVKVFIDAGYHVTREYGSGIVDLVFNIEPTEKSRAVVTAREHRAESRSIARLLSPRSIAVIGASREPTKIGHAALLNLLRGAFTGAVYPVHPEAGSVQGVHAYGSVLDIPEPVDLAVLAVPAARVAEVVQSCGAKGVHGLVVMTGFADDQLDGPEARRNHGLGGADGGNANRRPELPRSGQHRPSRANERVAGAGGATAGTDRLLLPVRRVGRCHPGRRGRPRPGPVDVRVRRRSGRCLRKRSAAVLARR